MSTEAYPLRWPEGWPRTPAHKRQRSRFDVTMDKARQELQWAIERAGGRYSLLCANLPLRRDRKLSTPRSEPEDTGVAVYFEKRGKQMVFACDKWDRVRDNIRAIEKTIEALRGIERWGASEMMERAFSAFEALPAPGQRPPWWIVLGVEKTATSEEIERAYRTKARERHPDMGGSNTLMAELNQARNEALSAKQTAA